MRKISSNISYAISMNIKISSILVVCMKISKLNILRSHICNFRKMSLEASHFDRLNWTWDWKRKSRKWKTCIIQLLSPYHIRIIEKYLAWMVTTYVFNTNCVPLNNVFLFRFKRKEYRSILCIKVFTPIFYFNHLK